MQEILVGIAAIWLVGLGLAVIAGKAGARWYVRRTRQGLRDLAGLIGRFLRWFVRTVLVAVGGAAASTVTAVHGFFYSRWPRVTLAVYGAAVIIIVVVVFSK